MRTSYRFMLHYRGSNPELMPALIRALSQMGYGPVTGPAFIWTFEQPQLDQVLKKLQLRICRELARSGAPGEEVTVSYGPAAVAAGRVDLFGEELSPDLEGWPELSR